MSLANKIAVKKEQLARLRSGNYVCNKARRGQTYKWAFIKPGEWHYITDDRVIHIYNTNVKDWRIKR